MVDEEILEHLIPLHPVDFLAISCDVLQMKGRRETPLAKEYLLPDLSSLHGDENFGEVAIAWSEKGIALTLWIKQPLVHIDFPNFRRGDSVELFFDTRDVKTAKFLTRYCHHFYFLPEPFENAEAPPQAGEITRFRNEGHELADPSLFYFSTVKEKKSYSLHLFIPSFALFGYDPLQFDRLGFTYRINRFYGDPQYFSVAEDDFSIEQTPALWASLRLTK